ncbi:NAD(+)/NADH kinase [Desulfopila inferna]|uniref:NAD(+)/NADH kinase n=1 Tax=Desulfopila inferna TaxID=468528 RepID=UPI00307DD126
MATFTRLSNVKMAHFSSQFRRLSNFSIRSAGIITKSGDQPAAQFADELKRWLEKRNVSVDLNVLHPDLSIVVVLGGDGTLLRIAEQAARYSIPVIGINLGHLGFLTELTCEEAKGTLDTILSDSVNVENRLMLKALIEGDETTTIGYALNDVVINKNSYDRILELSTTANEELITTYKADGLIFSTPTGSTAYNLSAGGPLVYPGLASILVTPICPFMLGSRPILLPSEITIATSIEESNFNENANVIVDGRPSGTVRKKERLIIKTAEHPLQLIVPPHRDYFSILRNKLHWGSPDTRR